MPEEKKADGIWNRIFTEVVGIIPTDLKEMIGLQVGIWLFALTPMLLVGGAIWLFKAFKEPKVPEVACWQVQKVDSRVFKLNACTGETVELSAEKPATSPQASASK